MENEVLYFFLGGREYSHVKVHGHMLYKFIEDPYIHTSLTGQKVGPHFTKIVEKRKTVNCCFPIYG